MQIPPAKNSPRIFLRPIRGCPDREDSPARPRLAPRRSAPFAGTLMKRRSVSLLSIVLVAPHTVALALADERRPELTRLRAHVTTLASREYLGRRGAGAQKAADYIVAEFRQLKLEP